MSRCIQLAKNGLGTTYPNPLVGSVVVHSKRMIGEGWHYKAGTPHAEVNAINSVTETDLLNKATIYVSLEPCSHHGKTPPCADLIIKSGIKKVVIGSLDPNPQVAGNGVKKLMQAGCDVEVGVLEEECAYLNKRFFTFHQKKRPFIILKWAQTADGFIAPKNETRKEAKPVWITNEYSRQLVHKMRAQEAAILVGTNTALQDNPSLTVRGWSGNNPVRLVIDKDLKIPTDYSLYNEDAETLVFNKSETAKKGKTNMLKIDFSEALIPQIINTAYKKGLQSIIIEGGAKTLQSFINLNLWDEANVFSGPIRFQEGTKAPDFQGELTSETKIKEDRLHIFKNPQA